MSQSSMELRFNMEDGGVQAGLKQAEAAERKLEVAVKAGNRTQKVRLGTENDLAKVLDVVAKAEGRAATASQKRAKASLAAQKSAALLADMKAKAAKEQRIATGWEAAAARAQLDADKINQARARKRLDETAKASERARVNLGDFGATVKAVGVALGSMGAGITVVRSIATEVARLDEAMVASALSSNTMSKSLRELVALQNGGAEGNKLIADALIKGAQRGLKPEQSAPIAQTIQSIVDMNGDGSLDESERGAFDKDFGAAAGLIESGVAPEDALKIITAGRARGQSGDVSADLTAKGASLSALAPSDVAKSISATSEFSDQKEALAILTGLSKEQTETGKLPAATERLGVLLGKSGEVGETEAFSKKYGLIGLTETQKVEALRQYGAQHGEGATEEERIRSFTATLPGEKGLGKEAAIDLARVVRQSASIQSTREALESGAEGTLDSMLQKGIDNPLTGPGIVADRQAALAAVGKIIGPQAEASQAALARRQVEGGAAIAEGDVANVNEDGTAKAFGEQTWGAWGRKFIEGAGRSASVGYGYAPGAAQIEADNRARAERPQSNMEGVMRVQESLVEELRRNNDLLEKNNAATEGNTAAAAAKRPVGGAAGNAEERY